MDVVTSIIFLESVGCKSSIQLEHLQDHLHKCLYNPNSEVICDKGCNMKMTRREYEVNNCFTHLLNIVNCQKDDFQNTIVRQKEQIAKLSDEVSQQRAELAKLNDEVCRLRGQAKYSNNVSSNQQWELPKLFDKSKISTPKWQVCLNLKNLKTYFHQEILEFGGNSGTAFAQLFHSLEQSYPHFKIKLLNEGAHNSIAIGLTRKGHPTYEAPGNYDHSIGYRCSGEVFVNKKCQKVGQEWKCGDVIECGIIFPSNFTYCGNNRIEFYFSINEQLVMKNVFEMPQDGFFPTIFMWGDPVFKMGSYIGTLAKVGFSSN